MKHFIALCRKMDTARSEAHATQALAAYLQQASPADAAWAVYLLAGGTLRRAAGAPQWRDWACAAAGLPTWLFDTSRAAVGDIAETVALFVPAPRGACHQALAPWLQERVLPLRGLPPAQQTPRILQDWDALEVDERRLYIRLLSGQPCLAASPARVQQALAQAFGLDMPAVVHRLLGFMQAAKKSLSLALDKPKAAASAHPRAGVSTGQAAVLQALSAEAFQALAAPVAAHADAPLRPYPFCSPKRLPTPAPTLGDVQHWQVQWAYGGLPVQLLRRGAQTLLWSEQGQLLNAQFPDVLGLAAALPDGTAMEGELLAWAPAEDRPYPAARLQNRLKRQAPGAAALRDTPVRLLASELLQLQGQDLRQQHRLQRHASLQALAASTGLAVACPLQASSWEALHHLRGEARRHHALGLMLKRLTSADAGDGGLSATAAWWWPAEPLVVRAVLVYAQAASGRWLSAAHGAAQYTFAVWNRRPADAGEVAQVLDDIRQRRPPRPGGLQLLPIARVQSGGSAGQPADKPAGARSGLSAEQQQQLARQVREQTVQTFGTVCSVLPRGVVELAVDSLNRSARHKSGLFAQGARLLSINRDQPVQQADTVLDLLPLLS